MQKHSAAKDSKGRHGDDESDLGGASPEQESSREEALLDTNQGETWKPNDKVIKLKIG